MLNRIKIILGLDNLSLKQILLKVCLYLFGTIFSTAGMTLAVLNDLGASPMTTCFAAVAERMGWRLGSMFTLFNSSFLFIGLLFASRYMGITSLLMLFIQGPMLNFWHRIFSSQDSWFSGFTPKFCVAIVGFLVTEVGLSVGMSARLGTPGFESCLFSSADKLIIEYKYLKIVSEALFLAIGIVLGGAFGIMTFVETFLAAPINSEIVIRLNNTLLKRLGIDDERNELYRNNRKYRAGVKDSR